MEKRDGDLHQLVGVQCRLCGEVILDEATGRALGVFGVQMVQKGVYDPVHVMVLLTVPLIINGGIHMLTCRRHKMN